MAIKVSRIEKEFILKTLRDQKMPLELVVSGARYQGTLMSVIPEELVFLIEGDAIPQEGGQRMADLYIMFKGTRVTCRLRVQAVRDDRLHTEMPENLYRDLSRGYERIRPEDQVGVSIFLEGSQFKLNFPASEEYYEPEPPSVNIKFDAAKITNLLKGFREKSLSFATENKIVMFRDRKPASLPEDLLAWSGKIILFPLNDATFLRQKDPKGPKILTQEDITRIFRGSGRDPLQLSHDLNQYIDSLTQKKIWHELYCPVLYREYVVGYIYLIRSDMQTTAFSQSTIEFVMQFARLLAYSLSQNGYFQTVTIRESFDKAELVDMSGSGLLFSFPLNGPQISIYQDLDMEIMLKKRKIPLKGRVMRRFQDSGRIYIGIKYVELDDKDLDFLLSFLYGADQNIGFADDPILS